MEIKLNQPILKLVWLENLRAIKRLTLDAPLGMIFLSETGHRSRWVSWKTGHCQNENKQCKETEEPEVACLWRSPLVNRFISIEWSLVTDQHQFFDVKRIGKLQCSIKLLILGDFLAVKATYLLEVCWWICIASWILFIRAPTIAFFWCVKTHFF